MKGAAYGCANPAAWLFADALLLALYHVELRGLERRWTKEDDVLSRRAAAKLRRA